MRSLFIGFLGVCALFAAMVQPSAQAQDRVVQRRQTARIAGEIGFYKGQTEDHEDQLAVSPSFDLSVRFASHWAVQTKVGLALGQAEDKLFFRDGSSRASLQWATHSELFQRGAIWGAQLGFGVVL